MVLAFACLGSSLPADACTLWGAAGEDAGGGTILSKNRDWKPDHTQVLKVRRGEKYKYLGLYAEGNDEPGIKQGVNEKGLGVVSATAGSIPKTIRKAQTGRSGLTPLLLGRYASCEEILADRELLFARRKPSFLMIADREQLIVLEVGLGGRYALKIVKAGTAAHCNHFLDPSLADGNQKIGESSGLRFRRVSALLEQAPRPLEIASFAEISRDQHDGQQNSLWRTGAGSVTLSSWILRNPSRGAPLLRVLLANPGKAEELKTYVLDEKFWSHPPPGMESRLARGKD